MSALRFIKQVEVTSSSSIVEITDVFSTDFDIYQIVSSNLANASTGTSGTFRAINSSGSVITSGYQYAGLSMTDWTAFVEEKSTSAGQISELFGVGYGFTSSHNGNSVSYCFNPYQSNSYTFFINQSSSGSLRTKKQIAVLPQNTSITGFQIYDTTLARPFVEGLIKVYGLRVDS